jgi:hypothetical protein
MIAANLTLSPPPAPPISAPSLFSLFAAKRTKLTPLFSYSSALLKKECLPKPFAINLFRTLSQNTGGCILSFTSPFSFELSIERSRSGWGVSVFSSLSLPIDFKLSTACPERSRRVNLLSPTLLQSALTRKGGRGPTLPIAHILPMLGLP